MTATMYSTPSCTYCKQAKKYFQELGISVKEIDITRSEKAAEELSRKTGSNSVPVILLKGATIIGFDRPKINRVLNIK